MRAARAKLVGFSFASLLVCWLPSSCGDDEAGPGEPSGPDALAPVESGADAVSRFGDAANAGVDGALELDARGGDVDVGDAAPAAPDAGTDADAAIAAEDAGPDAGGASDAGDGGPHVADAAPDGPIDAGGCAPSSACDDGNPCTTGDTCNASGVCVGTPVTCVTDKCHDVGTCDPATGVCSNPVKSCDDGDPCTRDSCDPLAGCRNVPRNRCGEPACSLGACAGPDTDGDGFSDAVEDADYIDVNCNGIRDQGDISFPHRAAHLFSAVARTGSGTGVLFPTVSDPTLPIATSSVVVTIANGGPLGTATFQYTVNGGPVAGPFEVRPVVDVAGNLRLFFYINNFIAGDTYAFTTSMGPDEKIADKNVPNVYVQYDYLGTAPGGAACAQDGDCDASRTQLNAVCRAGHCTHDHAPGDPLMRKVVEAYEAMGVKLYIDPVHYAVPHANVVTFAKNGDADDGPHAICAGDEVPASAITGSEAINFHEIKNRTTYGGPFDPGRKSVFRYAIFAHASTCLTDTPGAVGSCGSCPTDRSTPSGAPHAGSSGVAELPGNDFIVSLGASLDNPLGSVPNNPFLEGGAFMHELGHTLGLHHMGDVPEPEEAPNYLSVMNYKYVFSGIQSASAPGSAVSIESLRRLDYSRHTLRTLVESSLDEAEGVSPLASGYTEIVRFVDASGANASGPESGPIDWSGVGGIDVAPVAVDLNQRNGTTETARGFSDWPHSAVNGAACLTSADCRINAIRQSIHDTQDPNVDPHEPCVGGSCVSFIYPFQCFRWGLADGAAPPEFQAKGERGPSQAAAEHVLYPEIRASGRTWVPSIAWEEMVTSRSGVQHLVPVAIYAAPGFDVLQIDQTSLRLRGSPPKQLELVDADGDGALDMIAWFAISSRDLAHAVTVTGWLFDSQRFIGTAPARLTGP